MPRTYIKKSVSYDKSHLELALKAVENGKPIRVAAKQYSIPFETLRRWVYKTPTHMGSGRSTILTKDEEHCIVDALKFLADCGFPFDRQDILNIAHEYMKFNSKLKHSNVKLGIEWLRGFERRWSNQLTKRKPELLTKSRAAALSANVVNSFFTSYIKLIDRNSLHNCPERIFNLDEVGLCTDPRGNKVFVSKQSRNAYLTSSDAGKSMYTVLFCISASGTYMSPFTVFKSAHLYDSCTRGGPQGAIYGCSASSWMEDNVFESWMEHFVLYIHNIEKPIILIFDGHGSHLTYKTVKTALDNRIIILCLPPNTSHALQPLDVGVFAPAKKSWRLILKRWFRETRLQKVSKPVFPYLLKQLFETLHKDHAVKGFKGAGIFPPNMKEVEHKIVLTERAIEELGVSSTSLNTSIVGESTTTTIDSDAALPSCSGQQNIQAPLLQLSSPFKDLKTAILTTFSPVQASGTKAAIINSRKQRKRVQHMAGEVMTEPEVMKRLYLEEIERNNRKRINLGAQAYGRNQKRKVQSSKSKMELLPGKWVLIEYKGKRSIKSFIGQIMQIEGEDIHVKYVTKSTIGNFYVFPTKEDIDIVERTDIIRILEEPVFNSREQYHFKT